MTIKLDISKAYNKLEWCFLERMMRQLRFDEIWIVRVMTCISTISYVALINGMPGQVITPTREIAKVTLSSFIFILYVLKALVPYSKMQRDILRSKE